MASWRFIQLVRIMALLRMRCALSPHASFGLPNMTHSHLSPVSMCQFCAASKEVVQPVYKAVRALEAHVYRAVLTGFVKLIGQLSANVPVKTARINAIE